MAETISAEEAKATAQERILNAAEEIFVRNGFAGSRMSEIAIKAGVNQASIHYYFDSKEKLYEEVVTRLFRQWESYVRDIELTDDDPEKLLRKYIKEHFELKCKLPNLYKIYQREAIEGGDLFSKYASADWTTDTERKSGMLAGWKRAGVLHEYVNERVLLHLIWGMMNQFYFRGVEDLREELALDGTYEELQGLLVDQMIKLTLYGVLPREETNRRGVALSETERIEGRAFVLMPPDAWERGRAEIEELLEGLGVGHGLELKTVEREDELLDVCEQACPRLIVIVATTRFGEMSASAQRLLAALEAQPSWVADRPVAVWTVRDKPAAESLQRALEDAFNRLGAFAVSRVPGQTPREYARRCAKLAKR
ncbi:TetR/AcrR family transcriptional regulator [Cohnella massiliensis]|uniref:TetR/AcrR family transcriptional regulator n=1 Tax=Cohnella massiliensis TaxID=1816691 RepID=UPI0009BAAB2F|nr:TetR family transcriptional regulator [Cohnella massiliensis]